MIWKNYKKRYGARRFGTGLGLALWILLAGGQCLALDESCGSDDTDCRLEPLLAAYLVIESVSFRPPACGTLNPADYAEEGDGVLTALVFVGPISLTQSLQYDAGFVNRPLHLIGCEPALVSSSISVNAGPPTAVSESYTYNGLGQVTAKVLNVPGATFRVDVSYALNDYPALIRGDCQVGVSESSTINMDYDILSRALSVNQFRPLNCDASAPNQRVITSALGYTGLERPPTSSNTTVVETTAAAVNTTTTIAASAAITRDSGSRLTRRNQSEDVTVVVSSPASSINFARNFSFDYTYDSQGRMTQFVGTRGPTTNATINYTYDSAGRVVGMNSTGTSSGMAANSTDTFTYDANGNVSTHVSNFTIGPTNTISTYTFAY
ncbi:MAG: hypothetical protein NXI24_03435 [bacterium]|nr:hypothetical protein [bacterium]